MNQSESKNLKDKVKNNQAKEKSEDRGEEDRKEKEEEEEEAERLTLRSQEHQDERKYLLRHPEKWRMITRNVNP